VDSAAGTQPQETPATAGTARPDSASSAASLESHLYHVLAESAPDAILAIDARHRILAANPAAARLFGYPTEELVGRHLTDLMPERFRTRHMQGVERYVATGERGIPWQGVRVPIRTRAGAEIPVEISFGEAVINGERIFSGFLRDVSDQVAADRAIHEARTQAELRATEAEHLAERLQEQAIELEQQTDEAQTLSEELEITNDELVLSLESADTARQQLAGILESMTDAVSAFDAQWRWTYMNPAARAVLVALGHDPDAAVGRVVWDELGELDGTKYEQEVRRAARTGTVVEFEEFLPALGRCFENRIVPGPGGAVTTFTRDVTERRRAATELADREAQFRALANAIPQLAWMTGPDGWISWYNQRWYDYTGTTPEQMAGWGWQAVHHPAELPRVLERWRSAIASGAPWEDTFPLRRHDGEYGWFLSRAYPVRDGSGEIVRWFGTNTDITEQRDAVARAVALQSLTEAFSAALAPADVVRAFLEHGTGAVGAATGLVVLLTPGDDALEIAGMRGYSPAAIAVLGSIPTNGAFAVTTAIREARSQWVTSREDALARFPDAVAVYDTDGLAATAAVPLCAGAPARVVGAAAFNFATPQHFPDTQREFIETLGRLCAQALERSRLYASEHDARAEAQAANAAKSQFLAMMSHELRQPLNAITGYADLMMLGVRGSVTEQQREDLARIKASSTHLSTLINDILQHAKIEAGQLDYHVSEVLLEPILSQIVTFLGPQIAAKALAYTCEPCDPELRVRADPDRLLQAVMNLVSNAIKYTGPGGAVTLSASLTGQGTVAIRIHDTGIGIPADKLEAIFDPFVQARRSLSQPSEGVGLGLAIAREIARHLGGDITVESEEGRGSTFTLTLQQAGTPPS